MRRPDGRAAPKLALNHRTEAVAAQRALLLDVGSNVCDLRFRKCLINQRTISSLPLDRATA